jgi:hypothetical protein
MEKSFSSWRNNRAARLCREQKKFGGRCTMSTSERGELSRAAGARPPEALCRQLRQDVPSNDATLWRSPDS